jgi:hypothetical protein
MLATVGFVAEQYVQFPGFPASEELGPGVMKLVKGQNFLNSSQLTVSSNPLVAKEAENG